MASMSGMKMDHPGFHGMLLVGETTAYLSHLPMFMSPHNYQVILEVTLTKAGSDPLALSVSDRKATGTEMYSFAPAKDFVLTDLVSPDPIHPHVSQFPGTIIRGHFEDGHFEPKGSPLLADVVAHVTRVVQFRKLTLPATPRPQLEYLAFGRGGEVFVAHVITKPPDFDQVLGGTVTGQQFTDDQLGQGVLVTFAGRANDVSQKLTAQEQLRGQAQVAGTPVPLEPIREVYVHDGVCDR